MTSQLIVSGGCRQVEIIKAFGVSKNSVLRAVAKYRDRGSEAFFTPKQTRQGGTVLTLEVLEQAQQLLDQGRSRRETAEALAVNYDTLRKAINDGRLQERTSSSATVHGTSKSSRDKADALAAYGLGTACTRVGERVLAAVGEFQGAVSQFETCLDVPHGGVLCALPALLSNGLAQGADQLLGSVTGYYTQLQILLLLAFMALCRIKTTEQIRGYAPGEFGKLMGLDRIPEVRCLRKKMDDLCRDGAAKRWATHLSQRWMSADPGAVGTLYIDGHVRIYHGNKTALPRRYISRERLCLRATTDYWVNDIAGRPFFVIEKTVDPGLLVTLKDIIVPRLLKDVPNQPSQQSLAENPYLCRFILVFDREGYSPAFFIEMWQTHRIACITYHKYPDDPWPVQEFQAQNVRLSNGEMVTMRLAERGTYVGSGRQTLWMREVRKLNDSGHQTSLISTAYELTHTQLAMQMFSRWCQENFFRYMMQHFAIDRLCEQGTTDLPGTEKVVNPQWRDLDRQRNSLQNKLRYRQARFGGLVHHPQAKDDEKRYRKWVEQKSILLEEIEQMEHQLALLKPRLKNTAKHISWDTLDEEHKFYRLAPDRKQLMDTVRMIAYRAETAMARLLKDSHVDVPQARVLLQNLYTTEADILPDSTNNRLIVRIHGSSRPAVNRKLVKLLEQLNGADVCYPGTELRLRYELGPWVNQEQSDQI
ncbi:MAG TPA: hypothetical protein VIS54_01405, partial [Psychromonas sp.]